MIYILFVNTINTSIDNSSFVSKEEFEDTKGVIRIRKSKDRQHNGQKKKAKRINSDLKKHTHKTKDRVTRTPVKTEGVLRFFARVSSSCSTSGIVVYL